MSGFVRRRVKPFPTAGPIAKVQLREKPTYFNAHRRVLTLVGAMIIFLTFVVKDGKQKHLESQIDSIKSARRSLIVISQILRTESGGQMPHPKSGPSLKFASNREQMIYQYSLDSQLSDALQTVDQSLPTCNAMRETYESLSDVRSADALFEDWKADFTLLLDLQGTVFRHANPTSIAEVTASLSSQAHTLSSATTEFEGFKVAVWQLNQKVLRQADNVAKLAYEHELRLETQSVSWEYIGYALYTLGWSLALIGKFHKLDDVASGD
jgi:hypothetical protein